MIWIGHKINDDYAWEFSALHQFREKTDGISFCEFQINWDRFLADHTPQFTIMLVLLNYKIFEFNIYYIHHRDGPVEREFPPEPRLEYGG